LARPTSPEIADRVTDVDHTSRLIHTKPRPHPKEHASRALMNECVYCRKSGNKITAEHILPGWIYRETKNRKVRTLRTEKFIGGEITIRDTCDDCNNVILSRLDDYAKVHLIEFLDRSPTHETFPLRVDDMAKLTRWVIKVLYNSARSSDAQDREAFQRLVPFILGSDQEPPSGVALYASLMPSVHTTPHERQKFGIETAEFKNTTRLSRLTVPGHTFEISRSLSIDSFVFILISRPDVFSEIFDSLELTLSAARLPLSGRLERSAWPRLATDALESKIPTNLRLDSEFRKEFISKLKPPQTP